MTLLLILTLLLIGWLLWLIFRSSNPGGHLADFIWWTLLWWWHDDR